MPTILSTPMLACFRGERAWFHRCEITKQHRGGGTSLPALSRANPAASGPHCDEEPPADVNFPFVGTEAWFGCSAAAFGGRQDGVWDSVLTPSTTCLIACAMTTFFLIVLFQSALAMSPCLPAGHTGQLRSRGRMLGGAH